MDGVVHDTLIEHAAEHHLLYAVRMQYGGVQCVIEHVVERHLPYVVCVCEGVRARVRVWFKMVILCRTFPDERPAEAACEGATALTTIMQTTKTTQTKVTGANFIAALCHTRPGRSTDSTE